MRTLPFGFAATERGGTLTPVAQVAWSQRYLGRPVLLAAGSANDLVATEHAALAVRTGASEVIQLQSRGSTVEMRALDSSTLAQVRAWASVASGAVAGTPVGLTQVGSNLFALWGATTGSVAWRRSTNGGATWATTAATLHTAAVGNSVWSIMTADNGLVAVEERVAAGTALVYLYEWTGAAWSLVGSFDSGAVQLWGGGLDTSGSPAVLLYAGDYVQATTSGVVTVREVRAWDVGAAAVIGTLHRGSVGGVRWREPRPVSVNGRRYLLATVAIPRASGDTSDRVALFPYDATARGAFLPVGPPRVIYAVEDTEAAACVAGAGAVFVMAGSYVQRLTEGSGTGTVSSDMLDLTYGPEAEALEVEGTATLAAEAVQVRCRLGFGADLIDMGVFWIGNRVGTGREGYALHGYGLWGVLRRELQQQSAELLTASGDAMTPGDVLNLVFSGLGFGYSEESGLSGSLHPAAGSRLTWTLRYGQSYASLVRAVLRWVGCEVVAGVAVDGVTPTVRVMRPGSRFGPTPTAMGLGGVGQHPLLEVVCGEPEVVTDVTIFPLGMDHQVPLGAAMDRQLVLAASESYGITSDIAPATRALGRALAGADAGYVRLRPALEIELWDTVALTDTVAGLAAERRVVRGIAVGVGRGASGWRWMEQIELGLE